MEPLTGVHGTTIAMLSGSVAASLARWTAHPGIVISNLYNFRGDWSWNTVYGHFNPSADSSKEDTSYWRKNAQDVLITM